MYNVKILGYSVGITNSYEEAVTWCNSSMAHSLEKKILILATKRH